MRIRRQGQWQRVPDAISMASAMSAFLIPSSGGDAIPLKRSRVYLGRSKDAPPESKTGRETALVLLELVEGWWHLEDLRSPRAVRINGVAVKRQKLAPDDEIEIGTQRYRIAFKAPKYTFGRSEAGQFRLAKRKSSSTQIPAQRMPGGALGRLLPVGGGDAIPLTKRRITAGRQPPCDVVIRQKTVSSRHCELELIEGYWRIKDLDSRNGVRINGERCTEGWVLPHQRVTIGDQRFTLEYTGEGPPPINDADLRSEGSLMSKIGLDRDGLERTLAAHDEQEENKPPERQRFDILRDL
jgi:adenylate cyclase